MDQQTIRKERVGRRPRGNRWTGLIFLIVGAVLLMRQLGYAIPSWIFHWEMILIIVGLFIGMQSKFKDLSWLILILIGLVFLSDDIWPGVSIKHYAVPAIIIGVGLLIFFSPRRVCAHRRRFSDSAEPLPLDDKYSEDQYASIEEADIDIVSVFGSVKKRALSKNFKGGEIVCIFGGSEVNLTNADFRSPIVIDVTQIFGGTTLIMPANWEVRSEIAAIFAGIDDKRPQSGNVHPEKVIILKGTSIFGGIEIKSY